MQQSLQGVNKELQAVHEKKGLPVLSFGEGIPTTINTILPKLTVSFSLSMHFKPVYLYAGKLDANQSCCPCMVSLSISS